MEHGAYTLLLDWQYKNEAPVTDLKHAWSISRAHFRHERRAVKKIYEKHFKDGWNPRVREELSRAESRRQHAQTAINARWDRERNLFSENVVSNTHAHTQSIQFQTPDARQNLKTPLPPTVVGVSRNHFVRVERYGEVVEIEMGRHRRLPNLEPTIGMCAQDLAQHLTAKGFPAKVKT